jgi:hypothetical protein
MRKLVYLFGLIGAVTGCNLQLSPSPTPGIVATSTVMIQPTTISLSTIVATSTPPAAQDSEQATVGESIAATKGPLRVKLYMVALEDNGKSGKLIGCGDSLVEVNRDIPRTGSPLTDTLNLMFSLKDQYYGQSGLYNSLYSSDLKVEGISAHDGVFRVNLVGKLILTGVCEDVRIGEQIKSTIMQFSTVKAVNVYINGTPLEQLLSGRGG